jgi:KaiC/GvpD/RAD55 family RecA-like ATPase
MSEELDKIQKQRERELELHLREKAFKEKDLTLKEHRVDRDLNELIKNTTELAEGKKVNFGRMTQEDIEELVKSNDEYMKSAKNAMLFINPEFGKIVPYFRKNLILIAGDTGDGKSTTVANIIYSTITKKNPATGKGGKVLVLSNEEAPEDFYNRTTSLLKGWKYTNHDQFTDDQRKTFSEHIPFWAKNGRLTIIGDTYRGISGWTTTVEGIESIFDNLIRDGEHYDAIIIDYYQNVKKSKLNPKLQPWEVQVMLAALLDKMKLKYSGVIVIMAQMKRLTNDEDTTPFNIRLKGSKEICDKATFIAELIPERKMLRSKWVVWKSRFTEAVGKSIYTGYDRGKFVPYSIEFQKNTAKIVEKNLEREKEQELGIINQESKEELNDT